MISLGECYTKKISTFSKCFHHIFSKVNNTSTWNTLQPTFKTNSASLWTQLLFSSFVISIAKIDISYCYSGWQKADYFLVSSPAVCSPIICDLNTLKVPINQFTIVAVNLRSLELVNLATDIHNDDNCTIELHYIRKLMIAI